MNSIIYDEEVITPNNNKYQYYYNFLNRLEQKGCVKFALFCAKLINPNTKESNDCIELVEKWLVDEKSVSREALYIAYAATWSSAFGGVFNAYAAYAAAAAAYYSIYYASAAADVFAFYYAANAVASAKTNKYLQILLRKTKQFQNNKILKQISKGDVDRLELVDWNMITDIIQEEYNIVHEFEYGDIFSRRCLIELLRREYT